LLTVVNHLLPSGKHTQNDEKIHPFLLRKSTISTGHFDFLCFLSNVLQARACATRPHMPARVQFIIQFHIIWCRNLFGQSRPRISLRRMKPERLTELSSIHVCCL
jgi:hypothetical protein